MSTFEQATVASSTEQKDKLSDDVLSRVLGEAFKDYSHDDLDKLRNNAELRAALASEDDIASAQRGLAKNPELLDQETDAESFTEPRKGAYIRRFALKALGLPFKPIVKGYRTLQNGITSGYSWYFGKQLEHKEKFANMTDEEKQAHIERVGKWSTRGVLAAAGAAAVGLTAMRLGAFDSIGSANMNHSVSGGINPEEVPGGVTVKHETTGSDQVLTANEHETGSVKNRIRGPEEYPHLEIDMHATELDFLEKNGRHNNDFNNIPVDTLDGPENEGHFPGYTALREQFQKSPHELAAQLRQIQEIELEQGHKLDFIPDEFRDLVMKPGEGQEQYIARLGEAIQNNDDLHDLLTEGALTYIEENASPLQDLTDNYSANFIVIEDGMPTVGFDEFVQSADPNDKVLMLSATKGIRFPCGQCIEIFPDVPAETPVYQSTYVTEAPVVTETVYQPEAPVYNSYVPHDTPDTTPGGGNPGGGNPGGGNPGGENPGGETPSEVKGNEYPDHEKLTNDLGEGEKMDTPARVERNIDTNTGRQIGANKVEPGVNDNATNSAGSQTGGRDNTPGVSHETGQDTSSNAGAGGGIGAGDDSGSTNAGDPGSR